MLREVWGGGRQSGSPSRAAQSAPPGAHASPSGCRGLGCSIMQSVVRWGGRKERREWGRETDSHRPTETSRKLVGDRDTRVSGETARDKEKYTGRVRKTQRGSEGAEQSDMDRNWEGRSKQTQGQGERERTGGPALSMTQGVLCPDPSRSSSVPLRALLSLPGFRKKESTWWWRICAYTSAHRMPSRVTSEFEREIRENWTRGTWCEARGLYPQTGVRDVDSSLPPLSESFHQCSIEKHAS